jgi:predicted enzyme related to lactoylglutathione lyase
MNPVVHFEIPMENEERAKKFYSDIFGWKLNKMGDEYGGYVMVQTGPTDEKGMPQRPAFINGGMVKRGAVKSPVLVIAVEDCDATVEKAKSMGGKLVGEILDIPNVGRYAYVEDSEGNVIGVIKPIMPGNPQ